MIDKCYFQRDAYGRETFDIRAYEDNEQMQILSQMSQAERNLKKHCLASHNRNFLSFIKRSKQTKECTK